jgi:uncharacterized protein YjiS (DUF1127 family)
MSSMHETTELPQAAAGRQVFSPLEVYWAAFYEWRKRAMLRAELIELSDRELIDIGISRAEIDYVTSTQGIDPRGAV